MLGLYTADEYFIKQRKFLLDVADILDLQVFNLFGPHKLGRPHFQYILQDTHTLKGFCEVEGRRGHGPTFVNSTFDADKFDAASHAYDVRLLT